MICYQLSVVVTTRDVLLMMATQVVLTIFKVKISMKEEKHYFKSLEKSETFGGMLLNPEEKS